VQQAYISSITAKWRDPALNLFEAVNKILSDHLRQIIHERFEHFGRGGLQQIVQLIVTEHMKKCGERTKEKINWLIDIERRPFTLNVHYYSDYKDKFLAFYRGCRNDTQFMKTLQTYKPHVPNNYSSPTAFQTAMTQVLTGLVHVGINGTQPVDLAKLGALDPMEPALNIMAGVRAYFQVAYKRFTDIIPLAIDHDFVLGIERDIMSALYTGLKISGPDGSQICKDLVQEPLNISVRREELQKKLDRLNTARTELMLVGM